MEFRRLLAIGRRWWPLLAVSVLIAAGAAFVFSNLSTKTYEAKSTLIVGQSLSGMNPDYTQLLTSQRLSTTYASVATHRPRLEAVIEALGLDTTPEELRTRVAAQAPIDSTLVMITARASDPEEAAAIANALSAELIASSPAIQGRQNDLQVSIEQDFKATQSQIASTQARIEELTAIPDREAAQETELATLEGRLVTLRSTYATLLSFLSGSASNLLSLSDPAVAPPDPVSPRPLLNVLLAAILGLVIAIAIVAIVEFFRDALKDPEDIQAVTGLSTLGTIARMKGNGDRSEIYLMVTLLYPRSGVAEAYRSLRTNVEFSSLDAPLRSLLVTSALAGEGKTVTAANLAVVFAQAGRRVLLVDGDLRKPGVHLMFGLPNSLGLSTLMRLDGSTIETVVQRTEQDNLHVLTAGPLPPNPAELLGSQRMRAVLGSLTAGYDIVVVDSPPLQAVTDAAILSSLMDGCVFVIDAAKSRRRAVHHAREALARAGAQMLGAVLNRVPVGFQADYGGYYGDPYGVDVGPGGVTANGDRGGAAERPAT